MPTSREMYEPVARGLAEQAGIDPDFVSRLITQESGWNPAQTSKAGAGGIMQLMPSLAQSIGLTPEERYKPDLAMPAAIGHIASLWKKYGGDQEKVASAYNAGEPATDSGRAANFPETQDYIRRVATPTSAASGYEEVGPAKYQEVGPGYEEVGPRKNILQKGQEAFESTTLGRRLMEGSTSAVMGAMKLADDLRTSAHGIGLITGLPDQISGRHLLEAILHPGTDNPTTDEMANAMAVTAAPFVPEMSLAGATTEEITKSILKGYRASIGSAQTDADIEKVGRIAGEVGQFLGPVGARAAVYGGALAQAKVEAGLKIMQEGIDALKMEGITEAAGQGLSDVAVKPMPERAQIMYDRAIGPKGPASAYFGTPDVEALARGTQPTVVEGLAASVRKDRFVRKVATAGPLDSVAPPPRPPGEDFPTLVTSTGETMRRADLDAELSDIIARAKARGLDVPDTPDKIIKPNVIKPKKGEKAKVVGIPADLPDWVQEGLARGDKPKQMEVDTPAGPQAVTVEPPAVTAAKYAEEQQAQAALTQPLRGDWVPAVRMKDGTIKLGKPGQTHEAMVREQGINVQEAESTGWGRAPKEAVTPPLRLPPGASPFAPESIKQQGAIEAEVAKRIEYTTELPPVEKPLEPSREKFGTPEQQAVQDQARNRAAMEFVRQADEEVRRFDEKQRKLEKAARTKAQKQEILDRAAAGTVKVKPGEGATVRELAAALPQPDYPTEWPFSHLRTFYPDMRTDLKLTGRELQKQDFARLGELQIPAATTIEPPRPITEADMKGTFLMGFQLKDGTVVYDASKSPNHGVSAERMGLDPNSVARTVMVQPESGRVFDFTAKTVEALPLSDIVPMEASVPVVAGIAKDQPQTIHDLFVKTAQGEEDWPLPSLKIQHVEGQPSAPAGAKIERNWSNNLAAREMLGPFTPLISITDRLSGGMLQLEAAAPEIAPLWRAAGVSRDMAHSALRLTASAIEKIGKGVGIPKAWEKFDLVMTEAQLRGQREGYKKLARMLEVAKESDLAEFYGNDPWGVSHSLDVVGASKKFRSENLKEKADRRFANGDWAGLRGILVDAFDRASQNVGRTELTEAEYQAYKSAKWFEDSYQVAQKHLIGPLEESHTSNGGVPLQFPSELGYWPLIPKSEQTLKGPRTSRGIPNAPGNLPRSGLADEYDMKIEAKYRVMANAYRANNTAIALRATEKAGLLTRYAGVDIPREALIAKKQGLTTLDAYGNAPVSYEYQGRVFTADRLPGYETFVGPKWLMDEIGPVTAKRESTWMEMRYNPAKEKWEYKVANPIARAVQWATQGALLGPAEGIGHTFNLIGFGISKMPTMGGGFMGKVLALPIIKTPTFLIKAMLEPVTGPEVMEAVRAMVANGDMHPRYLSVTWSPEFAKLTGAKFSASFSPLLYGPHGMDIKVRLLARRLALMEEPLMSANKMHQYMNNFGQYNYALTDRFTRALKGPVLPFLTASSTGVRTAIHTLTQGGTLPGGVGMRVLNAASSSALAVTAAWIAAHKATRGDYPWEDRNMQLFKIRLTPTARASPFIVKLYGPPSTGDVYVNFGRLMNPSSERFGRVSGVRGAVETLARGGNTGQAEEGWAKDVINAMIQMIASPPVRFAVGVTTGLQTRISAMRDRGVSTSVIPPIVREKSQPGFPALIQRIKAAGLEATPITQKGEQAQQLGVPTIPKLLWETFLPSVLTGPVRNDKQRKALIRQRIEAKAKSQGFRAAP